MTDSDTGSIPYRVLLVIIVLAGLSVQGGLWLRQGISADQNAVLYYGATFAQDGSLPGFAKPSSAGLHLPGFLLPATVSSALWIWPNYRSPSLLAMTAQLAALLCLTSIIRRIAGRRLALLYALFYWLSVWRLFHGTSTWEPAFLFLPAALHMAICFRLRTARSAGFSALLALVLALTFQYHASAAVLVLATGFLVLGRACQIHWRGFGLGALISALAYLPTIQHLGTESALPRAHPGLLLGILSMFKAATFWIRLATPDIFERLMRTDGWNGMWFIWLLVLAGLSLSFFVPGFMASWRLVRHRKEREPSLEWWWLKQYALSCMAAVLVAALVSPAIVQTWHVIIVFHAAWLPVMFWLRDPDARWRPWVHRAVACWLTLSLGTTIILCLSHPMYRPPTRETLEGLNAPAQVRALVPQAQ